MTAYTIVNPFVGYGIAVVSGDDAAKVQALAAKIADALPHAAPANEGLTNGAATGDVLSDKGGITVQLFDDELQPANSDEENAAIKKVVG